MPSKKPQPTPTDLLDARRLKLAGAETFDPAQWAMRLGALALLAGVVWAGFSALRPLSAPTLADPISPPSITPSLNRFATLETREDQLAQLKVFGNIFSPDRKEWDIALADNDAAQSKDAAPADSASASASTDATTRSIASASSPTSAGPPRYEDIPVEKKPPVAIWKDLHDLRLRGVYRTDRGPIALIGNIRQKERSRSHARHVGEYFEDEDGDWTVLAIDDVNKRVILNRAGMNVELTMFPPIEGVMSVASSQDTPPVVRPPNPSVVVHTRTADQLRAELAQAGVSAADIEELLQQAQSPPTSPSANQTPSVAKKTTPKQSPKAIETALKSAPALSPAMADLLKMMSSGSAPMKPVVLPQFKKRNDKKPHTVPSPKETRNNPTSQQ